MGQEKVPRKPAPYRRYPDSCPLIGDPGWREKGAEWCPFLPKRQVLMPRGRGARWLVACPRCQRWVKTLYCPQGSDVWWCRHCWRLKYPSQYRGRRPECDPDRLMAILDRAARAYRRGNEALALQRAERFIVASDRYQQRLAEYELAEFRRGQRDFERAMARIDHAERQHNKPARRSGTPVQTDANRV
jgi:hypothetical protein